MTLQVKNLVKHFDGVQAVKGVSFEVRAGECVALIGPNGAGKSTTFACIAGQHIPTAGEIVWGGQGINGWPAARRMQHGIARTFQVAQTFEALTVLQNLQLLMAAPQGLSAWKALNLVNKEAAMALLAQVGLQQVAHADVLGLPYGAKKRLELAMALAGIASDGNGARLLLLDEPAAGLAGPERADLMHLVKSLAAQGISVLYTEHNMDAVFGVADRVLVLIDGQIAAQGTPDEIARNPEVLSRYLGSSLGAWAAERFAQVKEEPAQRAGDTKQNALPPRLPGQASHA